MDIDILWESNKFVISTPKNPHIPYEEGMHLIVSPVREIANAWEDINLSTKTFRLAAEVCKTIETLGMAPWFNIQANGNWGLLPGATPFFHIHLYSRNKTVNWGKALIIPELPNTYSNSPMPKNDQERLVRVFSEEFDKIVL